MVSSAALRRKVDEIEPVIQAQSGCVHESVYGIVDSIIDGKPHFKRRWIGTIGNMRPTDLEPTIYCIEKLEPAILQHKKWKCFFGGRAGTKSIFAMDALIGDVNAFGSRVFVLRERMKSLRHSIYSGIESRIKTLGIAGFNPVPSNWEILHRNKGKFAFGGLQNIIDMKGSFDFKYFLLEEAAKTTRKTLDTLGPTLRGVKNTEIWLIWNPEASTDAMSCEFILPYQDILDTKGFYEDDDHMIIKVGFEDNPWFPLDESLQQEQQKDYRKMQTKRMSKARYDHIWCGNFDDNVENGIIEPDWFDACIDAHKKLGFFSRGQVVFTHDPSDEGSDPKGFACRQGVVFIDAGEFDAENANRAFDTACEMAKSYRVDCFGYDADGMGALLRDQAAANFGNTKTEVYMFKGSASVDRPNAKFEGYKQFSLKEAKRNREVFRNRRAQNYARLAVRMHRTYEAITEGVYHDPDTLISFSSDIPQKQMQKMRSQLCHLPRRPSRMGMIELYTKPEMKRGIVMSDGNRIVIPSPNIADCLMMSMDDATIIKKTEDAPDRPVRKHHW